MKSLVLGVEGAGGSGGVRRGAMKERPIIFSGPMVRAILEGRKTQTRRIVKLTEAGHVKEPGGRRRWHPADAEAWQACSYGVPGDRLWVRETWGDCSPGADALVGTKWDKPWYRADADTYGLLGHDGDGAVYVEDVKWRPSIYMPRAALRITLEIKAVRIERLQDISEADAYDEGIELTLFLEEAERLEPATGGKPGRYAFRALWESLHGLGSWDANPLVWVIEFKRIEP